MSDLRLRSAMLAGTLLLAACPPPFQENAVPERYQDFFGQSAEVQRQRFHGYSADEQVEIFVYGLNAVHPPELFLREELARTGNAAIPAILREMRETSSEFVKSDLISVLELMACDFQLPLAENASLVGELRTTVGSLQVDAARRSAESSLKRILRECNRSGASV